MQTHPQDNKGRSPSLTGAGAAVAGVAVIVALFLLLSPPRSEGLVVYCAHDSVYSEQVLRAFERETGIAVDIRFDTEATKSLGLVEQIVSERSRPRCDVFWNNEQLGTMRLAEEGLLQPYKGEGYARIPDAFKDSAGYWTGFAARMRVWIVNTEAMDPTREAIASALASDNLSRVAIAKPLYGTTRTHYTVLWDLRGRDWVRDWHTGWRGRGLVEASGNAMVKDLVAAGTCHLGLTDTDDFFVAKDAGDPVEMLPAVVELGTGNSERGTGGDSGDRSGFTILIPNTVAIVKGTQRMEEARQLVEYLLSAETELALARSKSRQIPLGQVDPADLPEDVRRLVGWSAKPYPLSNLSVAAEECLAWLRGAYLK